MEEKGDIASWPIIILNDPLSHQQKKTPTSHYTACLIGILITVQFTIIPIHNWVDSIIPKKKQPTQGFLRGSLGIFITKTAPFIV